MRGLKLGFTALTLGCVAVLAACSGDANKVFINDPGPTAYIRFVNAIPDSGGQDWRFVDMIDGSPTTFHLTFRGIFPGASYQAAAPGSRHLRVFQSSLDLTYVDPTKASTDVVSTVFVDSTFTLTAGSHYTLMAVGSLRAKTAKLLILTDDYPDPGTSVAVRVVNAGASSAVDVYGSATGGSSALPSTPLAAGVAALSASPWITLTPGALALRANAAGSKTLPAMIDATAPAGVAANQTLDLTAVGGSTIAGSAFTAFLFPAATAGSSANVTVAGTCPTKCATPGVVFAVDRYPPSPF